MKVLASTLVYFDIPPSKISDALYYGSKKLGPSIDVENYRPGRNGREGGETVMYVVHYIFCTAIFVTLVKDFF